MLHCPRTLARRIVFSGLFFATGLTSALAADPTGDWRVADGVANIRVAQCNGSMWGAVAWEKEPGGKDIHNPDASKQSRPTLGMPILIDMKKKAGVDSWEGQVYNAKDGQLYSSTIKPVGADQLEIQGCVLGFLCVLAFLTYFDRVCIASAQTDLKRDLGLTTAQMGWVFSAFVLLMRATISRIALASP